jgi:3-methyladenine DNA glycosylase AlkD
MINEVIQLLRDNANERGIAHWQRSGVQGMDSFGIGLTQLKKLAKPYRNNDELADALFKENYYDAKVFACLIWNGKTMSRERIESIADHCEYWSLSHVFSSVTLAKSPLQVELFEQWRRSKDAIRRRLAFALVYNLAGAKNQIEDTFFEDALKQIRTDIHSEENFIKDAMNNAVLGIGRRNATLHQKALEVAKENGVIEVDYGDNSCQALDVTKHLNSPLVRKKLGL